MKTSDLTAHRLREILNYNHETGVFTWKIRPAQNVQIGDKAGCKWGDRGYWRVKIDSKAYSYHRLVWLYMTGAWPLGEIDHKNGEKTDNRFENLRDVTSSVNQQNRRAPQRNNVVGLLGVYWESRRSKWISRIMVNGKKRFVGYFDCPQDAHVAYIKAKRALHVGCTL
jgi:hypothetical protein